MKFKFTLVSLALVLVFAMLSSGGAAPAQAATSHAGRPQKGIPQAAPVNQLIVKYKASVNRITPAMARSASQMARLSAAAGQPLTYFRSMSGEAHVLRLAGRVSAENALAIAARLAALPEVEYAEPDYRMFPIGTPAKPLAAVPSDTFYSSQWHYVAPTAGNYGINAPAAWDVTTGSASVYIAVLDTGILNHTDLSGRWVGGYDFIADPATANDGDGRDSDPHDPGDWTIANECYSGSSPTDSSWHGTHVAGTIAAATNNSQGVAGINWVSRVVPVRVLGKCGGYTSDIADAIVWASGGTVSGVPANPYPAKVINMSLSGSGTCSATYQNAINAAYNNGSVIVVAAGNEGQNASLNQPANCSNVITVAATHRGGDLAWYSNYGSVVEISAPGGDMSTNPSDGVLSTSDGGTTNPLNDNSYYFYEGTSMAAPHVSGVVSLMFSVNPSLTPPFVLAYLQNAATPFPSGSTCSMFGDCGSGIVNAAAAVAAAQSGGPLYHIFLPLSIK